MLKILLTVLLCRDLSLASGQSTAYHWIIANPSLCPSTHASYLYDMTESDRRQILEAHRPDRLFPGEPQLGGWYTDDEIEACMSAIRSSMDYRVGFGFIVDEITDFEEAFATYCGTRFSVSVVTASVGLDMAVRALDLEPGDEVIVPAINFKASALAILGAGGKPVFCEIDSRTFCADPEDVARRITPRTRGILPVHMNGLSCAMDDLVAVADAASSADRPIRVIGDAARACGGGYKNGKIGKVGWANVFSFHTMKLMSTLGEGGMITTDDEILATRLRSARQWGGGTGEWGSSYKLTKVQAAVGSVQVRRLDEMLALRAQRARERTALLEGLPHLTLPYEPPDCTHTWYLYTLLAPAVWAGEKRDRLMEILKEEFLVGCMVGNPPVWEGHDLLRKAAEGQIANLAVSADIGRRLLCVGLHPQMTEEDNAYIAAAVWEAVVRMAAL